MTKTEFAKVVAYITAGSGKALSPEAMEVYFDCLGDLTFEVASVAAKRVLLAHPWATFPSIAELREASIDTKRGELKELAATEAWELAWRAVGRIDPEVDGSAERALAKIPPMVREAINDLGLCNLCHGKEPVAVIRSQFVKAFEAVASRARRTELIPEKTQEAIREIGKKHVPYAIGAKMAAIGGMP